MGSEANFADPSFEPTDEQLEQLSHEAFAGVAEQHRRALVRLREQIAQMRAASLARIERGPASSEDTR